MNEKPRRPFQFGLKWLFAAAAAVGGAAVLPRPFLQILVLLLGVTLTWAIPFGALWLAESTADIDRAWLAQHIRRWWRR